MSDLDRAIRESFGNLVERAGTLPVLDDIAGASADLGRRSKRSSRMPWLAAAAVVVGLALAGGAVWVGFSDDKSQGVVSADGEEAPSTTASTVANSRPLSSETTVGQPNTTASVGSDAVVEGRPGSWVGVSAEGTLVEVDTASGEVTIIHELGGGAGSGEDPTLDRAHRQPGSDVIWASAGGDPSGGTVLRITEGTPESSWFSFGFAARSSPDGEAVAVVSFAGLGVAATSGPDQVTTVSDTQAFGNNSIAWLGSSRTVVWTYPDPDGTPGFVLEVIDLDDRFEVVETRRAKLAPDLAGNVTVAVRGDDAIVVSGCTADVIAGCGKSRTVVLDQATLDLAEELDLAPGALLGGYDPSGRFLIYTDGDQVARWYSESGAGILGQDYRWASW